MATLIATLKDTPALPGDGVAPAPALSWDGVGPAAALLPCDGVGPAPASPCDGVGPAAASPCDGVAGHVGRGGAVDDERFGRHHQNAVSLVRVRPDHVGCNRHGTVTAGSLEVTAGSLETRQGHWRHGRVTGTSGYTTTTDNDNVWIGQLPLTD